MTEEPVYFIQPQDSAVRVFSDQRTEAICVTVAGEVFIDWAKVEEGAAQPNDPLLCAVCRLALAVRDGTWKPLQRAEVI